MSIEKNKPNFLRHANKGFTTILNETINAIRNHTALAIYTYLAAKPEGWEIINKDIMNHFYIGRDLCRKGMDYLKILNLLKIESERDDKGRIVSWHTILCAQITENPYSGSNITKPLRGAGSVQITELPESGETAPINKREIQIKENIINSNDIVNLYHELLPNSPKIKVIDSQLDAQLKRLQKDWPKYNSSKEMFTLDGFARFLRVLKTKLPGFLEPYPTASGKARQNNLRTFTRPTNIAKCINGEFSF